MVGYQPAGAGDAEAWALNYRETCPAGIDPLYYERHADSHASTRGATASGVPGTVAGLLTAHGRYGRLSREVVMAPAIRLAREGFAADKHYADAAAATIKKIKATPGATTRFTNLWRESLHEGRVRAGDRVRFPAQARALELVARDGMEAFYRGAIAEEIVRTSQADGGVLTLGDLRNYTPAWIAPIRVAALSKQFLVMPPPSSGGVALAQIVGVLDRRGGERLIDHADEATYTHNLVEAMKFAFADRAGRLYDGADIGPLLDANMLERRARSIDADRTHPPAFYAPLIDGPRDAGTSHLCVIDAQGMAVACTETVNLSFGSWLMTEQYGVLLNNQMDDFTTKRGEKNAFGLSQSDRNLPSPGKRPLSSMSPTIVIGPDGQVEAVAGGSGGPRIISATVQVLLNVLMRGDDAPTAVSRARVHHQWLPDRLEIERSDEPQRATLMRSLIGIGHAAVAAPGDEAAVQLAVRGSDGTTIGAADPRKGGAAVKARKRD